MKGKRKLFEPVKKGTLRTSMLPLATAASINPPNARGQIVGGLPASFGVKPNSPGRPKKTSRRRMY